MATPSAADRVAAVVVTHDGERWLPALLDSIAAQTRRPDLVVVVDDASTDGTRALLRAAARTLPLEVVPTDGSGAPDLKTRVAANAALGLGVAAAGHDVVVVSDQDDVWWPDRVERQAAALAADPRALLVAGDGRLVDEAGVAVGGTLRDRFPVPTGWPAGSAGQRMEWALTRPLVTGSAMAVTAACVRLATPVPRGWLHDRWATLVAAARGGLLLADGPVIDYRVHAGQVVGDRQAGMGGPRWARALRRGATPVDLARRVRDVAGLRPLADDEAVRARLAPVAVLLAGFGR